LSSATQADEAAAADDEDEDEDEEEEDDCASSVRPLAAAAEVARTRSWMRRSSLSC
jgi:hypothetical protein